MRHIKQFENNNNTYYIITNISSTEPLLLDLQLFSDLKSAENYLIELVNEVASNDIYYDEGEEIDTIFTMKEAEDYINTHDYAIKLDKMECINNYELPENLVIGGDSKKYNL